ncbi:MAG TPA: sigma 54-interacting transcriptional regulator [Polyangium sp.]|nr:sigma 54-interacting transcriptional regulator [Polyangium sp.]
MFFPNLAESIMIAAMVDTVSEETAEKESEQPIGLLTYVLNYDDLSEDRSFMLPPIDARHFSYEMGRSVDGPPRYERDRVYLPDRYVSSKHARIRRIGVADHLQDLGSKHHTYVNGQQVEDRALEDGDLIEVGHSLLCYRRVKPSLARMLFERGDARLGLTRSLSPAVARLAFDLERIAVTDESVVLLGERGTDKEGIAKYVHGRSGRKAFTAVDCGAVTETLFESEFFGHERDAFPGAKRREGYLRSTDGGTLFLDEIGNMPVRSQEKLLRAIQVGMAIPVGSDKPSPFDIRWIAATNADIFDEKQFRPDLRDRLANYVGRVPALRQRREDFGILSAYILRELQTPTKTISKPAARYLFSNRWTGNIRAFESTLRTAAILAAGEPIELEHLGPLDANRGASEAPPERVGLSSAARAPVVRPQIEQIRAALRQTEGHQTRAADLLNTTPRQLYRWMKDLGLSIDEFRR